jgi:hypothetical protein
MLYLFLYRKLHKEFRGGRVHIVEACGEVPLVNGKWFIFKQTRQMEMLYLDCGHYVNLKFSMWGK